jgi:ABC-2 type transport system ATP-binding protein
MRNVGKSYGRSVALADVSLQVESGECFGLIGPNGAGKSTLVRIAAGILTDYRGWVRVFGLDMRGNPGEAKKRIGYLPEEPSLYPRPTARSLQRYFARLYGCKATDERVDALLSFVGLRERAQDRVGSFSKGMRQRLAIARALVHGPDLLMLDEPTMGLDPATADRMRNFILSQREEGRTILLCTHYMDEAEALCDRVGVIDGGRLVSSGTVSEMKGLCGAESNRLEVLLENPRLDNAQLSVFKSYKLVPNGIVGEADLDEAYLALRPNGVISIRRVLPSLKDSFVLLTEGEPREAG